MNYGLRYTAIWTIILALTGTICWLAQHPVQVIAVADSIQERANIALGIGGERQEISSFKATVLAPVDVRRAPAGTPRGQVKMPAGMCQIMADYRQIAALAERQQIAANRALGIGYVPDESDLMGQIFTKYCVDRIDFRPDNGE